MDFKKLSYEEKINLANSMYRPVRCGGLDYDKDGNPCYIHGGKLCSLQEHNDIIKNANLSFDDKDLPVI